MRFCFIKDLYITLYEVLPIKEINNSKRKPPFFGGFLLLLYRSSILFLILKTVKTANR